TDETPTDIETPDSDSAPATCLCAEGTLTVVSGCTDWPDATECTGFHSVVCANEPHASQSYCDYQNPDIDSEFAAQSWDSGTQFTGYDCTIKLDC
ncbi:MAG TPA: hypothetical protein P5077_11495, partial [bacterium]|nr:hypothetical protein [bacterium]